MSLWDLIDDVLKEPSYRFRLTPREKIVTFSLPVIVIAIIIVALVKL